MGLENNDTNHIANEVWFFVCVKMVVITHDLFGSDVERIGK